MADDVQPYCRGPMPGGQPPGSPTAAPPPAAGPTESPAYSYFLPPVGSTPRMPPHLPPGEYDVYYEEEDWIPYSDASSPFVNPELPKIPGAPGSNYIVIEEEVIEEIPPQLQATPTRGSPCVVKRTRRKITRRPLQGPSMAQRLAAMERSTEEQ